MGICIQRVTAKPKCVAGVISSFLLFFILPEQGYPDDVIRTLIFLKLLIAGHRTLYVARSEGWFWERPWPSPLLFGATFSTGILGTIIAVYGFMITSIGRQPCGYRLIRWHGS